MGPLILSFASIIWASYLIHKRRNIQFEILKRSEYVDISGVISYFELYFFRGKISLDLKAWLFSPFYYSISYFDYSNYSIKVLDKSAKLINKRIVLLGLILLLCILIEIFLIIMFDLYL